MKSVFILTAAALIAAPSYAARPARKPLTQTRPTTSAHAPYVWRNVEIGGGGGFVDGIVFHPKQPGLIYCRTDIGGVYRYDNAVKRWIPLTDWVGQENGNLRGAESIAIDPTDPRRLYVAAGTYSQPQQKTAILRSDDQGRTFRQTPMPLEMGGNEDARNIGERLAVGPNHPASPTSARGTRVPGDGYFDCPD